MKTKPTCITEETKKNIIKKYVEENPTPNENFTPLLVLRYSGCNKKLGNYTKFFIPTQGKLYYNYSSIKNKNLEDMTCIEELNQRPYLMLPRTKDETICGSYVRFVEEANMLEISYISIPGGRQDRTKNLDKREWKFYPHSRLFIFKNDPYVYDTKGQKVFDNNQGRYYNKTLLCVFREIESLPGREQAAANIKKFFLGMDDKTAITSLEYEWSYSWIALYKGMIPRTQSKNAKNNIELNKNLKLTDIEKIKNNHPVIYEESRHNQINFIFFEKANDASGEELGIFRVFKREYSSKDYDSFIGLGGVHPSPSPTELTENGRIIIDKKGKVTVTGINKTNNIFEIKNNYHSLFNTYSDVKIVNLKDCENFEPIKNIVNNYNNIVSFGANNKPALIRYIIDSLRRPIFQELADKGYIKLSVFLMKAETFQSGFQRIFGYNGNITKTTKLEDVTNMTNEMLEELEKNSSKAIVTGRVYNNPLEALYWLLDFDHLNMKELKTALDLIFKESLWYGNVSYSFHIPWGWGYSQSPQETKIKTRHFFNNILKDVEFLEKFNNIVKTLRSELPYGQSQSIINKMTEMDSIEEIQKYVKHETGISL